MDADRLAELHAETAMAHREALEEIERLADSTQPEDLTKARTAVERAQQTWDSYLQAASTWTRAS